jgi:hypothetical protein
VYCRVRLPYTHVTHIAPPNVFDRAQTELAPGPASISRDLAFVSHQRNPENDPLENDFELFHRDEQIQRVPPSSVLGEEPGLIFF